MYSESEVLKSMELFKGLAPVELSNMASLMRPVRVKEGEIITRAGQPAHTFYVIMSGSYVVSFEEGRAFTLHNPGDFLGWSFLNASTHYTGTSTALTDGDVLALRSDDFMRLLQKNTVMADEIMKTVSTRKHELRYGFTAESNRPSVSPDQEQ